MYNLLNICSIAGIYLLKKKINVVVPFAFAYSVIDSLILLKKRNKDNKRKTNQLIIHHVATSSVLLIVNNFPVYKLNVPKILEIELSTLLILLSKKIKILKPVSYITWVYYRLFYLPICIHVITSKLTDDDLFYKISSYSMHTIEALGFVWTLESFKVPKKYLRPCCVSTLYSNIPVIEKCIKEKNYLLLSHTALLIVTSVLHHSNHKIGSLTHKIDKINAHSFAIHVGIQAYNKVLYCKYLSSVLLCYSVTIKLNETHQDTNRDYDNILQLSPHIIMHFITCEGVNVSVFEKKSNYLKSKSLLM
jgi:hypothetical protein